jgi:hypothetical protein
MRTSFRRAMRTSFRSAEHSPARSGAESKGEVQLPEELIAWGYGSIPIVGVISGVYHYRLST